MTPLQREILALEEELRRAELGPDPQFFETYLADDAVMIGEGGQRSFGKAQAVEAHRPGNGPKFVRVEMKDMEIVGHGCAAVVTCNGTYETAQSSFTLKFMRVWVKTSAGWQIVAGSILQ